MKNSISTLIKTAFVSAGLTVATVAFSTLPANALQLFFSEYTADSTQGTQSAATLDFQFYQSGNDVELLLLMQNTTPDLSIPDLNTYYSSLVGFAIDVPDILKTADYNYSYDPLNSDFTVVHDPANLSPYGDFDFGIQTATGSTGEFAEGDLTEGLSNGELATVKLTFSRTNGDLLSAFDVEEWFNYTYGAVDDYVADPIGVARFLDVGVSQDEEDKVLASYFGDGGTYWGDDGSSGDGDDTSVPEPGTLLALGTVILGTVGLRRKQGV